MFNLDTADSTGRRGSDYLYLIDSDFQHSGNKKIYRVRDVVWMGDTDVWGIYHECITPGESYGCVRTLLNFLGSREKIEDDLVAVSRFERIS